MIRGVVGEITQNQSRSPQRFCWMSPVCGSMGKLIQQLDAVSVPRCSVQEEHEQQQILRWPSNDVAMGTSSLASHVLFDVTSLTGKRIRWGGGSL